MADLIDRAAALSSINVALNNATGDLYDAYAAIAALPAQGVRVKPLIWTRADEDDGVPQWVSGRYFVRYTSAGYKLRINGIEMPKRYFGNDADEQAKADADKDHAARILAALEPAEAGGVEAKRLRAAVQDMVIVARQDGWAEATTGRQIVLRAVEEALAAERAFPAPVDALVKAAEVRGIKMALRAGLSAVANAPPNTPERDISLAVFQSISALIGEKP